MLDKLKILKPNVSEQLLQLYLDIAIDSIYDYLVKINIKVKKEKIVDTYSVVVLKMVLNIIDGSSTNNIKQMSQGSKSVTYSMTDGFVIGDDIKSLLPLPKVKLMG